MSPALELQSDLNDTARHLTRRCSLEERVSHVCGNVLDGGQNGKRSSTPLVSFLCFLHIPDRETLLARCFDALKPCGRLFVEDFSKLTEPTADQWDVLKETRFCAPTCRVLWSMKISCTRLVLKTLSRMT